MIEPPDACQMPNEERELAWLLFSREKRSPPPPPQDASNFKVMAARSSAVHSPNQPTIHILERKRVTTIHLSAMTAAAAVADQSTFEHENEPLKKRSEREFCKEEEGGRLLLALPHSLALTLNPDDCHSLSRFVVVCLSVRLAVAQVIRLPSPWHFNQMYEDNNF